MRMYVAFINVSIFFIPYERWLGGGGGKIALNKYPSGLVVKNSFRFNFSPFNLLNDVLIQVCKSRISNNIKF